MLNVTFPHFGNAYIPFRTLFTELGLNPIIPPPISQRTIALGTQLAPEFACFPLKVNLGNYLEAIELGAEMIFMAGGVGPCRFGYYGELQREILHEAGYDLDFLVLEAPKTHPAELWEKICKFFPKHSLKDITRAVRLTWSKADALDTFDRRANQLRAIQKIPGSVTALQEKFYQRLDEVEGFQNIRRVRETALAELESIPVCSGNSPLKVLIVGEIYMVLESKVNFDVERLLGEMGVLAERTIYFTEWVWDTLLLSIIYPKWRKRYEKLAEPYLRNFVGGHGLETVAHTVEAGLHGYDGVVQIMPFTCMPEIVAMQALPDISRDLRIPVLTIIIDEHSAEAGIMTRLEAFCDLLHYNKKRTNGGKTLEVVSGG